MPDRKTVDLIEQWVRDDAQLMRLIDWGSADQLEETLKALGSQPEVRALLTSMKAQSKSAERWAGFWAIGTKALGAFAAGVGVISSLYVLYGLMTS
jgi:hypothetical protein